MDEEFEMRVAEIKENIRVGSYRVDPGAVADAIIRQLRELALASADCAPKSQRPANT